MIHCNPLAVFGLQLVGNNLVLNVDHAGNHMLASTNCVVTSYRELLLRHVLNPWHSSLQLYQNRLEICKPVLMN